MRVVVDTNILISAIGWDGNERALIRKAVDENLSLLISKDILHEFLDVVHREKFSFIDRNEVSLPRPFFPRKTQYDWGVAVQVVPQA